MPYKDLPNKLVFEMFVMEKYLIKKRERERKTVSVPYISIQKIS